MSSSVLNTVFQELRMLFRQYRFWADETRLALLHPQLTPVPSPDTVTVNALTGVWEEMLQAAGFPNPALFAELKRAFERSIASMAALCQAVQNDIPLDKQIQAYRACFGDLTSVPQKKGAVIAVEDLLGECLDYVRELYQNYDVLTNLPNRHLCEKTLGTVAQQAPPGFLGVCVVDIDHFKNINDTCGHGGGDLVLTEVASVLAHTLRNYARTFTDTGRFTQGVFRQGGEEFVVILECRAEFLWRIGERLRAAVADHTFAAVFPHKVTVSVGAASGGPGNNARMALNHADDALYTAKRGGRNQCVLWTP